MSRCLPNGKRGPTIITTSWQDRLTFTPRGWHWSAVVCLLLATVAVAVPRASLAQQWRINANNRIDQHRKANLTVEVVDTLGNAVPGAEVQIGMKRHSFTFGTAVTAGWINNPTPNGNIYREKLLENFNEVVFENDLKYPPWIGLWGGGFNWPNTQQALDWLDANNLPTRGHYLSWATWSGSDAWGASQNINTLPGRILDHISDILPTVGTRVYEWDVINHPVGWLNDTYENRLESAGLYAEGLDFFAEIVNHAREIVNRPVEEGGLGGAHMPLWINEDDIISGGSRANDYERIIDYLFDHGAGPDGIGFQAHFIEEWGRLNVFNRQPQGLYDRIDRFADKGVPLRATEFDINVGPNEGQQSQADEQEQGELMRDFLTVMFSHPAMEAITMWGFWEGSHWMPNAALYRDDWSEKPALTAYQDLVFGEWWTMEEGLADGEGDFAARAFKGWYDVAVTYNGQEYLLGDLLLEGDTTVQVIVEAAMLDGDFNLDGVVNAADYVVWRNGFGVDYDENDYDDWRLNFGTNSNGNADAAAVPEPASLLLFAAAALTLGATRRRSAAKRRRG